MNHEEDLKFLKKLKRDELLYIVLKKCIYHDEELVIDNICEFLRYKDLIKTYFRLYTKQEVIDFIENEDVQQCIQYISRREIARRHKIVADV